ncbi:carboxylating nicotinate-nucleotide diphosphorylase [Acidiferrimicrobium sp. IK]|uniref:carboxylating nicotinate-nucleotide diphosphorylase n=1 Tax=Acidiferrimicrobium sp. IK TaxID=2871700 RepID=UPI0021CB84BE|nr:carboxylating nicotinate-nucleotide diphosphorylase [Acidiferrimicrobium sp. IK]MCU4186977.1 carboxylating nicotinate-nucleotide diphosphorylase [Acidiferrimicrobium sp. IK]
MSWIDPPVSAVREVVARALAEDLGVLGDLTATLVPDDATVTAVVTSRADGVLAGRLSAAHAFAAVDPAIDVSWSAVDGDRLTAGQAVASVEGPLASVLTAERTALNLLGHLSGVATLTRRYADAAGPATKIRDTRKTTPGLRALEKAAVRAGGGVNHRGSLSDGILVKDNHLAGLPIAGLVAAARARWPGQSVEVECDTIEQVRAACAAGADMVLVDNMTPAQVAEAVAAVGGTIPVEVSGRVTLDTVAAYAAAGADLIAVGALTHSAPVLDIGLDLLQER